MRSDEWRELRAATLRRAKFTCEHCHAKATQVHHVRYPKNGEKHTLEMLVAVCDRCHDLNHGVREMENLIKPIRTDLDGPFNNSVSVFHSNGLIWASVDQWMKVLQAPYFMKDFLEKTVPAKSALMKGGQYSAICGGIKVFRWPPIASGLDSWQRSWLSQKTDGLGLMPQNERAAAETFARNIERLKFWGYELQEKELQGAMKSRMSPEQTDSGVTDASQAMQVIKSLAQSTFTELEVHGSKISKHDVDIRRLKETNAVDRDPDEFVTVKHRILERSLPHAMIVSGRLNLSEACGQYLKSKGKEKGGTVMERLEGNSLTAPASLWRRMDIDEAIDEFMPSGDAPRQLDLLG